MFAVGKLLLPTCECALVIDVGVVSLEPRQPSQRAGGNGKLKPVEIGQSGGESTERRVGIQVSNVGEPLVTA